MKKLRVNTVYLLVTVDTEEDNWGLTQDEISLENIKQIPEVQKIFDKYNIRPVYLYSTPVVENASTCDVIKKIFTEGRCDIGAHLHPWNTPPLEEEHNEPNTHLKNLPKDLVKRKISYLTGILTERFGLTPIMFRAGRWGADSKVFEVLSQSTYQLDTSISPYHCWTEYGDGADFSKYNPIPFWWIVGRAGNDGRVSGSRGKLLEIPASIGFNRALFRACAAISNFFRKPFFRSVRLLGVLSYTGIMKPIWLSPEFNNCREMLTLSEILLRKRINLLNLTFHSPSLVPGLTTLANDSLKLLSNLDKYLYLLTSKYHVVSVTGRELLNLVNKGKIRCGQPKSLRSSAE